MEPAVVTKITREPEYHAHQRYVKFSDDPQGMMYLLTEALLQAGARECNAKGEFIERPTPRMPTVTGPAGVELQGVLAQFMQRMDDQQAALTKLTNELIEMKHQAHNVDPSKVAPVYENKRTGNTASIVQRDESHALPGGPPPPSSPPPGVEDVQVTNIDGRDHVGVVVPEGAVPAAQAALSPRAIALKQAFDALLGQTHASQHEMKRVVRDWVAENLGSEQAKALNFRNNINTLRPQIETMIVRAGAQQP